MSRIWPQDPRIPPRLPSTRWIKIICFYNKNHYESERIPNPRPTDTAATTLQKENQKNIEFKSKSLQKWTDSNPKTHRYRRDYPPKGEPNKYEISIKIITKVNGFRPQDPQIPPRLPRKRWIKQKYKFDQNISNHYYFWQRLKIFFP